MNSSTFCKHIARAAQANPQTKALTKSLKSQRKKNCFKKFPAPSENR